MPSLFFFRSLDFHRFLRGAAEAAAGRGSPPPPRAGEARLFAASVSCLGFVFPFRKDRCVLMISRKTRRGLMAPWFLSPLARGGPGGARTREIACFLRRKPLQNTRNGGVGAGPGGARIREIERFLRRKPLQNTRNRGVGAGPGGARIREIEAFRVAPTHYLFLF